VQQLVSALRWGRKDSREGGVRGLELYALALNHELRLSRNKHQYFKAIVVNVGQGRHPENAKSFVGGQVRAPYGERHLAQAMAGAAAAAGGGRTRGRGLARVHGGGDVGARNLPHSVPVNGSSAGMSAPPLSPARVGDVRRSLDILFDHLGAARARGICRCSFRRRSSTRGAALCRALLPQLRRLA
jgi:hypothetical protein